MVVKAQPLIIQIDLQAEAHLKVDVEVMEVTYIYKLIDLYLICIILEKKISKGTMVFMEVSSSIINRSSWERWKKWWKTYFSSSCWNSHILIKDRLID
jgi:hypothetical protein